MRAAVIFGLGASPADLKPFQTGSRAEWLQGMPASSGDADAILIFGGDGTMHRHLPALVRLQISVLIVPAGSGNDFARALNLRSMRGTAGLTNRLDRVEAGLRPVTTRMNHSQCVRGH